MLKNILAVLFILSAAFIGAVLGDLTAKAQAQQSNPHEYCNAIATYAESVATARDRGVPLIRVIGALEGLPEGRAVTDMTTVIAMVYTNPHVSPEIEAGLAFDVCWQTYGE